MREREREERKKDPPVNDRHLIFRKSLAKSLILEKIYWALLGHTLKKYMPN